MVTLSQRARRLSLFTHLLWLSLSILLWSGRQFWEYRQGVPFSLLVYGKGLLLLWLAALIYAESCRRRPGFLFLGFFPLVWLSLSQMQWFLCYQLDHRYWFWLASFLLMEFFLLALRDGRQLFPAIATLGAVQSILFPFSLPVFLSFGWMGDNRHLRNSRWVRYGLPLAGVALFLWLMGRSPAQFFFYDLYEVLINQLFISFFLLGCLGTIAFVTHQGRWNPAFGPLFLICAGFLFWAGPDHFSPLKQYLLKWVLVFFAGFGWEAFRRDMMDRTWHGRAVWFLLGLCFIGGVLLG